MAVATSMHSPVPRPCGRSSWCPRRRAPLPITVTKSHHALVRRPLTGTPLRASSCRVFPTLQRIAAASRSVTCGSSRTSLRRVVSVVCGGFCPSGAGAPEPGVDAAADPCTAMATNGGRVLSTGPIAGRPGIFPVPSAPVVIGAAACGAGPPGSAGAGGCPLTVFVGPAAGRIAAGP
jgi:hypothetical protein